MATFPFFQVDAFTHTPLQGNPCAVIFDADPLTDTQMLAVAREMNLSETAFVIQTDEADFAARYFTPAEEIPMAGHPTIATIFALHHQGRIPMEGLKTTVNLKLPAGLIPVTLYADGGGRLTFIEMTQLKPEFLRVYEPGDVLPVFNLDEDDLMPEAVIQTVSTGTPQLMIPLQDHQSLRKASLNVKAYSRLRSEGDFFSPHLFCLDGVREGHTFARHFGVPPDTPEDPFTGSATGGMAAYLWHYGLIPDSEFIAEQGHWMSRPGFAKVRVEGPRHNIENVKVAGRAAMVLQGRLEL